MQAMRRLVYVLCICAVKRLLISLGKRSGALFWEQQEIFHLNKALAAIVTVYIFHKKSPQPIQPSLHCRYLSSIRRAWITKSHRAGD